MLIKLAQLFPETRLIVVGFSMGANVVTTFYKSHFFMLTIGHSHIFISGDKVPR